MRFLIYGAGNIGSLYAARLAQSSQDVSILARGTRLEQIRRHGIQLEDGVSGQRSKTSPELVTRFEPDDAYDVVLVILPRHRIAEVLPLLAANHRTPSIMFFGNNAAGPDAMIDAIGRGPVQRGFPRAAAGPPGDAIRYVITSSSPRRASSPRPSVSSTAASPAALPRSRLRSAGRGFPCLCARTWTHG
jgi:2-dehydropantoate 2-reductase